MAETIYETTIANYESVIGALPANTVDTPYTVRITDIENLTTSNLRTAIINTGRIINIIWSNGAVWNGTEAPEMFRGCTQLKSIDTSPFINVTNAFFMFYECMSLVTLNTASFTNVTNAEDMFYNCHSLQIIDTTGFINVINASSMFYNCRELTSIDTTAFTNVISAVRMFYNCEKLTSINTGVFTNVTNAREMFAYCTSLEAIDMTPFTNATDTSFMFEYCSKLSSIVTTGLTNVTNAECMFLRCTSLTAIDTSPFVNVQDAKNMFNGCTKLSEIDTTAFTNVIFAKSMFGGCTGLTSINITPFINVTNADNIFYATSIDTLEISSFQNPLNTVICHAASFIYSIVNINVTEKVYFPIEVNTYKLSTPSNIQAMTWHYNLEDLKLTTIANYENNVSSLDANISSTPYDIQITDIENLTTSNLKTAIINAGKFVNITWAENAEWNGTDATEMFENCTPLTEIDTTPFVNVQTADEMFNGCINISEIDEANFIALVSATAMFDGTGKTHFDFTASPNLATLSIPDDTVSLKANGTALTAIDLSNTVNLEYLDVSNTNITSLNLIHCSSLPYCEWDTINEEKVLVKGWLAQNCTSLLTVKATETQVQDANLNLKNDTNALEGCTALQEVEVACNSRPSYSGNEVHYGKVKFENEVVFNNGLSLGEQALKDIFNIFVPVNKAKYIQLGGDPYPWEFYPFTKKTDWKNISNQYANEFFRVAGGEKPMGYFLTEDTEIVAGKTYYTRSGTDPNYTYTAVASPVVADIGTYYELSTNLTASTINNGDSDYLHITQAEGIPNIRGIMNAQSGLNGGCEGAFSRGGSTKNDSGTGGNHEGYVFTASSGERKINGSYKNDVYGKSDHVTTYNSAIQIWRRIS